MKKTYLQVVLDHTNRTQAQASRRLGWSTGRVGYLCSPECAGFPFKSLWHLKAALNISDAEQMLILNRYFTQFDNKNGRGNCE